MRKFDRVIRTLAVVALAATATTEARAQGYGGGSTAAAERDIVAVAVSAGTFTTLVQAVQAAGLVETLQGAGPFTVFAPTDEAFARLPAGTVEALIADPERLRQVLTYHVVAGRVTSAQVVGLDRATTVQGGALPIRVHDGTVHVGGATVTQADIQASNGVIHVIDAVLLPPTK